MNTREYLSQFNDSIYELVNTYEWSDIENKMDQDETFTDVLLAYVEARLAEEAGWSARVRISKTTHPVKKERLLAEAASRESHLAAIERRQQIGYEVSLAYLGEDGIQAENQRRQELTDAWTRASQAGLI